MKGIKIRGCEGEEEEGERGLKDGCNLGKRQREGRGKRKEDKLMGCLRGEVGQGGNREEEIKRGGRGRLI